MEKGHTRRKPMQKTSDFLFGVNFFFLKTEVCCICVIYMCMCLSMSWECLILYGIDLAKRISLNLGLCAWAWPLANGSTALNTQPLPSGAHFAGTRPAVLADAAGGRSAGLLSAPSSCFPERVFAAPPYLLHTSALFLPIWWVIFSKALWQLGDRRALRKICFEDLHVSWTFF